MTDCRCNAGKICDLHVEEVMGNLNKAVGGIQGGIVGGHLGPPTPEQKACIGGDSMCPCQDGDPCHYEGTDAMPVNVLPDLHGETVKLCLRVKGLEDGRKFNLDLIENLAKRLNEAEDKLEAIEEQFLHFIELRKIKGTG